MTKELSARFKALFIIFMIFSPSALFANMVIDNAIVNFEPGKPNRQDVTVSNTGDEPLYIKITPSIITNPGSTNEKRERLTNPKTAGLLVSPNKMVVPPGNTKMVRFVNLNPERDHEGVYRVRIEPVSYELSASTSGIKLLVGYEVLVLAQPHDPKPNLIATRNGNMLNLSNEGNTNIYLQQGRQCPEPATSDQDCEPLNDKRLYPGNQWQIRLPLDQPVQYQLAIGTKHSAQIIY